MIPTQQLAQSSQETKRFGKYEVKEEYNNNNFISLTFYGKRFNEINSRLKQIGLVPIDESSERAFYTNTSGEGFRICDLTLEPNSRLFIIQENPAKRKKARKFLEEILS